MFLAKKKKQFEFIWDFGWIGPFYWENGWTEISAWKQIIGSKLAPSTQSVPIWGWHCVEDVKVLWNSCISKTHWTTACKYLSPSFLRRNHNSIGTLWKAALYRYTRHCNIYQESFGMVDHHECEEQGNGFTKTSTTSSCNFTSRWSQNSIYRRIRENVSHYEWKTKYTRKETL